MEIIFVAGTGTEVGKTYVTKGLAETLRASGVRVGVYKPVASGCIPQSDSIRPDSNRPIAELVSSDAVAIWEAAGKPLDLQAVCPQCFRAAAAPDEAARREGKRVNVGLLIQGVERWRECCETLIVEGAGGLFSPIADDWLNVDLLREIDAESLYLVAPNRLGVIHDVVATCRAAEQSNVAVSRLYLSDVEGVGDDSCQSNADQIRHWLPGLELRRVGYQAVVT